MIPELKVICNRIAEKTCTHTTECCMHRIPHKQEEACESHPCRFHPEGAECVAFPVQQKPEVLPVKAPEPVKLADAGIEMTPETMEEKPEPMEEPVKEDEILILDDAAPAKVSKKGGRKK